MPRCAFGVAIGATLSSYLKRTAHRAEPAPIFRNLLFDARKRAQGFWYINHLYPSRPEPHSYPINPDPAGRLFLRWPARLFRPPVAVPAVPAASGRSAAGLCSCACVAASTLPARQRSQSAAARFLTTSSVSHLGCIRGQSWTYRKHSTIVRFYDRLLSQFF